MKINDYWSQRNRRVTLRWILVLQLYVAVMLLIGPPLAHADPATDAKFIDILENSGFVLFDHDIAINNAHLVCARLWAGDATTDDLAEEIDEVETNLDLTESKAFVSIAIQSYCPNIGARTIHS